MPSASAKLEKQASADACDPMKNVLTIVEKKVRNLEKRKAKLDLYRQDSQSGKELNDDQKKAVEKYDQVVEVLDFAKELQKQFQSVIQESTKAQKKNIKREILERQQQELQRIKELVMVQELLNSMGGEEVRKDFLSGTEGAVQLTENELNSLDELYKAICPERDLEAENNSDFEEQLAAAADHIQALLDGKNKEVFGTTYKSLKETLLKIQSCSYFNKSAAAASNEPECEPNQSQEEEAINEKSYHEEQYEMPSETNMQIVEESMLGHQGGLAVTQDERQYFPMESSSLYTEQTHPIQEVLSIQGNLNFLQESQIEVESGHANSSASVAHPGATFGNIQYTTSQPPSGSIPPPHRPIQRLNDEMVIPPTSVLIANSTSVAHQVPASHSTQAHLAATNLIQPPTADFDPARPIPTQTYTNQSFNSAVHPMMAAVTQNYVPATISHGIPSPHAMTPNLMTIKHLVRPQPLEQALTAQVAATNALSLGHGQGSAINVPSTVSQVQQQMNMDRNNSQAVKSSNITSQFECREIEEGKYIDDPNKKMSNDNNRGGIRDNSRKGASNAACSKGASEIKYGNERGYQNTNNSQAYMNRESFGADSSYSSNLKRGLNSRGGARPNNVARGGSSNPRGGRTAYRN